MEVQAALLRQRQSLPQPLILQRKKEEAETEAAGEKKDGSEYKIGLVTDVGGVNDGSFNQSSWEGLERAGEELGVTVNYLESATDADYAPNIETFIDEDYDLIICVGYMLADATKAVQRQPDTSLPSLMTQVSIFRT